MTRLEHSSRVQIHTGTEVRELRGGRHLESIVIESRGGGRAEIPTRALFVMIGADPCTDWVAGTVELDAKGFVVTGRADDDGMPPSPYATSLPGVFAVGDVRSGSVKRVASAVGEGSVVVQAVHSYLGGIQTGLTAPLRPDPATTTVPARQ
jgi:thioredoxin reductase (NADPH)